MSKILKNTTNSDIEIKTFGQTVPANGQLLIDKSEYALLSSDDVRSEIYAYIVSGDIVVNDGAEDLSTTTGWNFTGLSENASGVLYDDSQSSLVGDTVQDALDSISQGTGIPSISNIIYVSKNGDDSSANGYFSKPFLTIKEAIAYINETYTPSQSNPYSIFVAPGYYVEDPFTLPDYVSLVGQDELSVFIEANDPSSNLITLGDFTNISNFTVKGVTGASAHCIYYGSGGFCGSLMNFIRILDCSNGMHIDGTSSQTAFTSIRFLRVGDTVDPITGTAIHFGEYVNATVFNMIGGGIAECFRLGANCFTTINGGRVVGYTTSAIHVEDYSTVVVNGLDLLQESSAPPVIFEGDNSSIKLVGCIYDDSRCQIENRSNYSAVINDSQPGERAFLITEELHVGSPEYGRETALGQGDSYVRGMLVYNYDGSSYTDITEDVRTVSDSVFNGFPNTSVNTAMYICSTLDDGNLTVPGIRVDVSTAASGGEVVAEYYDGSSWVEFNHMSTDSSNKYLPYAKAIFQRAQREQVRFDNDIRELQSKSDPMSLGTSYYWIRFRIVSALSVAPQFDKIKIHTDRLEINHDGFVEYFGQARPVKALSFTYNSFEAANDSPTNQDLYYDDILAAGRIENEFSKSSILTRSDKTALAEFLPIDIDTSCKVKLQITFATQNSPSGTDQVGFRVYWNKSRDGDNVYETSRSSPSVSSGRQEQNMYTSVTEEDTQYTMYTDLDFSDFSPRDENDISDLVWLAIVRNDSIDTYSDLVTVMQIRLLYVCANEGGHL